MARERAPARTDLRHAFNARFARRFRNQRERRLVFKEMLAEFARQTLV